MGDITTSVASTADAMVDEAFTFANTIATNYMQEFLLLALLSVIVGFIWKVAYRFLGRR